MPGSGGHQRGHDNGTAAARRGRRRHDAAGHGSRGTRGTGWTPRARTTHATPLPSRRTERTDPNPRCRAPRYRPPHRPPRRAPRHRPPPHRPCRPRPPPLRALRPAAPRSRTAAAELAAHPAPGRRARHLAPRPPAPARGGARPGPRPAADQRSGDLVPVRVAVVVAAVERVPRRRIGSGPWTFWSPTPGRPRATPGDRTAYVVVSYAYYGLWIIGIIVVFGRIGRWSEVGSPVRAACPAASAVTRPAVPAPARRGPRRSGPSCGPPARPTPPTGSPPRPGPAG